MILKEKLIYSFIAISMILGNSLSATEHTEDGLDPHLLQASSGLLSGGTASEAAVSAEPPAATIEDKVPTPTASSAAPPVAPPSSSGQLSEAAPDAPPQPTAPPATWRGRTKGSDTTTPAADPASLSIMEQLKAVTTALGFTGGQFTLTVPPPSDAAPPPRSDAPSRTFEGGGGRRGGLVFIPDMNSDEERTHHRPRRPGHRPDVSARSLVPARARDSSDSDSSDSKERDDLPRQRRSSTRPFGQPCAAAPSATPAGVDPADYGRYRPGNNHPARDQVTDLREFSLQYMMLDPLSPLSQGLVRVLEQRLITKTNPTINLAIEDCLALWNYCSVVEDLRDRPRGTNVQPLRQTVLDYIGHSLIFLDLVQVIEFEKVLLTSLRNDQTCWPDRKLLIREGDGSLMQEVSVFSPRKIDNCLRFMTLMMDAAQRKIRTKSQFIQWAPILSRILLLCEEIRRDERVYERTVVVNSSNDPGLPTPPTPPTISDGGVEELGQPFIMQDRGCVDKLVVCGEELMVRWLFGPSGLPRACANVGASVGAGAGAGAGAGSQSAPTLLAAAKTGGRR